MRVAPAKLGFIDICTPADQPQHDAPGCPGTRTKRSSGTIRPPSRFSWTIGCLPVMAAPCCDTSSHGARARWPGLTPTAANNFGEFLKRLKTTDAPLLGHAELATGQLANDAQPFCAYDFTAAGVSGLSPSSPAAVFLVETLLVWRWLSARSAASRTCRSSSARVMLSSVSRLRLTTYCRVLGAAILQGVQPAGLPAREPVYACM